MSTSLGNSGMQRASQLVIDKKVGGISLSGYPRTYSFLDTFGNYIAINHQQLASLSIGSYIVRLSAFKNYVETIETGISINTTEAYKESSSACPFER